MNATPAILPALLLTLFCCLHSPNVNAFQVMMFTEIGAGGYDHNVQDAAWQAMQQLATTKGTFNVTRVDSSTSHVGFGNLTALKQYAVVMWISTTANPLNETERANFEAYIRAGGGYLGVHGAADCHYDWAWYGALLGGFFYAHPAYQSGTVYKPEATLNSSLTSHLAASFTIDEEFYTFTSMNTSNLTVVLAVNESSYLSPGETAGGGRLLHMADGFHPMAWYQEFDGGRSFYTAFGHATSRFSDAWFVELLYQGLLWTSGAGSTTTVAPSTEGPTTATPATAEPTSAPTSLTTAGPATAVPLTLAPSVVTSGASTPLVGAQHIVGLAVAPLLCATALILI